MRQTLKRIIALLAALMLLLTPVLTLGEETEPEEETSTNSPASAYEIGNTVVFGRFEQDRDKKNGPEPIEWIVLDTDEENHKALLISRLILDCFRFHDSTGNGTWNLCTLRNWLNGDFLNSAFTPEEQEAILVTEVDNSVAQGKPNTYGLDVETTQDRIFLLSYAEVNRYFPSNEARLCTGTNYAFSHGLTRSEKNRKIDDKPAARWFLRSPGVVGTTVFVVSGGGVIDWWNTREDAQGVRPVLWIDLEAEVLRKANAGQQEPEEAESEEVEPEEMDTADAEELLAKGTVTFGSWEQDNNKANGTEPIEWLVVDTNGNKALLVSKYGLIVCGFADNNAGQTWADSALRGTLNNHFFQDAFTEEEKDAILVTRVDEGKEQQDPEHAAGRFGESTKDRIFALSYAETLRYFPAKEDRLCYVTEYIRLNGNRSNKKYNGDFTTWYWMRTPAFKNNACVIDWDGSFETCFISHPYGTARPCCWVDATRMKDLLSGAGQEKTGSADAAQEAESKAPANRTEGIASSTDLTP